MPKSPFRLRFIPFILLILGLFALHLRYPLPYVYRVLVYQDSDFSDIHRFPARSIAATGSVWELPERVDPRVAAAIESHPHVSSLQALLEETSTSAFLVMHDGRLVEERYLLGHDATSFQNTFSVSKSVASALVGLALKEGLLHLEDPVTDFVPELTRLDPAFGEIRLEHLLDMRSGITYSSHVGFPFIQGDDPLIYYSPDLESILLRRLSIASPPGEFQYNNYNPPLIGLILARVTGTSVAEYLEANLWRPLGAEGEARWTTDDEGFERMESGFHARARDLARFGQLYLERGLAHGERVLDESWIDRSTELSAAVELERYDGRSWGYRGGWWIVPRPQGPSDFCAIGRYGQFVYVSPQYDTVFVRTGPGRGDWGDRDWTALFYFVSQQLGPKTSLTSSPFMTSAGVQ